MAMTPKILFAYAMPAVTGPSQITSGPASGKQWIITRLSVVNAGAAGECLITQGISGTDYEILGAITFTANDTINIGPIIMDNGNDMDATSTTASATFDIVAYGYERDV